MANYVKYLDTVKLDIIKFQFDNDPFSSYNSGKTRD